jgi:hypothetical protein
MRSNANGSTFDTQRLYTVEISIDGSITETPLPFLWWLIKTAPGVGCHEQDNAYSCIAPSLYYCFGHHVRISIGPPTGLMMYIVKLPHASVAGSQHFAIGYQCSFV